MSILENAARDDHQLDRPKLFPARPAEEAAKQALAVKEYIDGNKKPLELTDAELEDLKCFELGLNQEIEPLSKINIKSQALYLDFFVSEAGQRMLKTDFSGEDIPSDHEGLKKFFYGKQDFFNQKTNASLKQRYESESLKASNAQLSQKLLADEAVDGKLQIAGVEAPQVMTVILNPQDLNKKWDELRKARTKLLALEKSLGAAENAAESENSRTAKKEIVIMYRHRVNEILMQLYGDVYLVKSKQQVVGDEGLNPEERALAAKVAGFNKLERSLSLLDKMLRGVGELESVAESEGNSYQQISANTRAAAREIIDVLRPLAEDGKDAAIREKGLDPTKVFAKAHFITPEERKVFGDTVLSHYKALSAIPASPETLERKGTVDDGGWQFVTGTTGTMAIDPSRRYVRDANQPRSPDESLAVGTAHEIEGHVLQALNRQEVPLAIMSNMNTDRRTVMAESGAVQNEKEMNKAMLGFDRYSEGVDSIVGLEARAAGKSYLECVEVVFESKISHIRAKYDLTDETQRAAFMIVARKVLNSVIERTKRLFRSTDTKLIGLDRASKNVTNSQEAAYTEQEIVFQKLQELGLEKLAYIGLNLRTVLALLKLGLIDLNNIRTPDFKTLELWEKGGIAASGDVIAPIKDRYQLDQAA